MTLTTFDQAIETIRMLRDDAPKLPLSVIRSRLGGLSETLQWKDAGMYEYILDRLYNGVKKQTYTHAKVVEDLNSMILNVYTLKRDANRE